MAGTYIATNVSYPNGQVSVQSTDAVSYEQLKNSMGSWVYLVKSIYMRTLFLDQLISPLYFKRYNSDGTIAAFNQINAVDPYQYQNSLFFKLVKDEIVLDGRTSLTMNVNPSEVISMIIRTEALQNADYLKRLNFFQDDIFKGYSDEI